MVKFELLQLTALHGPYKNFTLTVKDIGSKGTNFGIGLAKIFPDVPGEKRFFYIFLTNRISARRFDGHNGSIPFLIRPPRNPGTRWETKELKQMKLTFNAGQFQMFANGELRAEFDDPDFDQINVIGFVLVGFKEVPGVGEAWVDSFMISGPSLGVEPKGKLATTWGKMKRPPSMRILKEVL